MLRNMAIKKTELKAETKYLQIMAIADNRPHFLYEISRQISHAGCMVVESAVHSIIDKQTVSILIKGTWHQIAKVELALNQIRKQKPDLFFIRAIELIASSHTEEIYLPYSIHITGLAEPQHLPRVIEFLMAYPIHIHQLQSEIYNAKRTHSQMISISLQVSIRATVNLGEMRDQFMVFCDNQNLDAFMEPTKG